MADNYAYTPGTGGTGASDDIGGVHYQRVKLIHGADGVNDGDVAVGNPLPVVPTMAASGNISAQTNATGTNWTAFGSQACKQLTISNQTGTTLEFRQGGSGVGLQVPSGAFYTFFGLTNANQLEARRVDQSNTQVTVTARWES